MLLVYLKYFKDSFNILRTILKTGNFTLLFAGPGLVTVFLKKHLHHLNMSETTICEFCNNVEQTLDHIFYHYPRATEINTYKIIVLHDLKQLLRFLAIYYINPIY